MLDVHLVDDAGARRHHLELAERPLPPAQELVALPVALVLEVDVPLERVRPPEHVRDHRMVDDKFGGDQWVDLRRVTAEIAHGLTHGGEIDHGRYASEVLHDHSCGGELDLRVRRRGRVPARHRGDVARGDARAALVTQQVLEQDLQAERETSRPVHRVQAVHLVCRAAGPQAGTAAEAVRGHSRHLLDVMSVLFASCPSPAGRHATAHEKAAAGAPGRAGISTSSYLTMNLPFILSTSSY